MTLINAAMGLHLALAMATDNVADQWSHLAASVIDDACLGIRPASVDNEIPEFCEEIVTCPGLIPVSPRVLCGMMNWLHSNIPLLSWDVSDPALQALLVSNLKEGKRNSATRSQRRWYFGGKLRGACVNWSH